MEEMWKEHTWKRYLQEVNGTGLMVLVMNYYLCSFSMAMSSTCESVTMSL